jgi:hypothetical protein
LNVFFFLLKRWQTWRQKVSTAVRDTPIKSRDIASDPADTPLRDSVYIVTKRKSLGPRLLCEDLFCRKKHPSSSDRKSWTIRVPVSTVEWQKSLGKERKGPRCGRRVPPMVGYLKSYKQRAKHNKTPQYRVWLILHRVHRAATGKALPHRPSCRSSSARSR